jgi:hypothetical protein
MKSSAKHRNLKGELPKMQIAEMRSALEADHNTTLGALPAMPAWVVRRVFEKRNGLPLTSLPREVEVRRVRMTVAGTPHVEAALATESEREAVQRRIRATQIFLLR